MEMMKRKSLRIIALALVVVALVCCVSTIKADDTPKLIFSGFTMETHGDSLQAFMDIEVANLENAGVGFDLEYDSRWVELSAVSDNSVHNYPLFSKVYGTGIDTASFVKWNTDDFAEVPFNLTGALNPYGANGYYNVLNFNLYVSDSEDAVGGYVERRENVSDGVAMPLSKNIINAKNKKLTLCSLSFKVKDDKVAEFAKLSKDELRSCFRVATRDDGASVFNIEYVDASSDPPLLFYDTVNHLSYDFAVENSILSVEVNRNNQVTNAAAVFAKGEQQDLLDWMNLNMRDVTVIYADGTRVSSNVEWDVKADGFAISEAYDCTGGKTYVVTQTYNEDVKVQATVTVDKVTVQGFACEKDYLIYDAATVQAWEGNDFCSLLELPDEVEVLFDTQVTGKTADVAAWVKADSWRCDVCPDGSDKTMLGIKSGMEGAYEYSAEVALDNLPKWATVSDDMKRISVMRVVGDATPEPEFIAEVTDAGELIITVTSVAGYDDLSGFEFPIRLPGGLVLDKSRFAEAGGAYNVTFANGGAVITLKAGNTDDAQQAALQKTINLGKKLGKIALAAKASAEMPQSNWVEAETDPRKNVYLARTGGYLFDYSGIPQILSLEKGKNLPTVLALPQGDVVGIRYSGLTGLEPGVLSTIEVVAWNVQGAVEVGNTVTLTGVLADAVYADHGQVYNTDDEISVSIKVMVVEPDEDAVEKIDDVENIVFSTMTEGYTDEDPRDIKISNVGEVDIAGLTISIKPNDDTPADAFKVTVSPSYLLKVGESINCLVERSFGLPVGEYGATITIGSNRKDVLKTFTVSFKVTDEPVYKVVVLSAQPSRGVAKVVGSETYLAADTVNILAEPVAGCIFAGWRVDEGPEVFTETTKVNASTSFTMPDLADTDYDSIVIYADFLETDAAVLRLQELHLFNPDNTENPLLKVGKDGIYSEQKFDSLICDYYAVVPDGIEANIAKFKFILPEDTEVTMDEIEIEATLTVDEGAPQKLTISDVDETDGLRTIENIALSGNVNRLTITLAKKPWTSDGAPPSYTVTIRKKLSVGDMVQMNYGNSPYGLIMKDDTKWRTLNRYSSDEDGRSKWQNDAKAAFDKNNAFVDDDYSPDGAVRNLVYYSETWGESIAREANVGNGNYDRNEYALFAYYNQKFDDPGLKQVKNSLGDNVASVGCTIYGLVKMDENAAKPVEAFKQGTPFDWSIEEDGTTLNKRVRPGVYYLSYEFEDYDGELITVTRPFIVLYKLGDVNMDGMVASADVQAILGRYNNRLPYEELDGYQSNCRLYRYRICDVNNDSNINVGDSNVISDGDTVVEFYK